MTIISEYFNDFCQERNIKKSTIKGYKTSINKYTTYYNMSLDELIDEALHEEDEKIPLRHRSLKRRLLQFRTFLLDETDLEVTTIELHLTRIKALYSHFEVELPKISSLKDNRVELTFLDLPTRRHIYEAVGLTGLKIGSLILFMGSSGTGRKECSELRVCDVIDACQEYIKKNNGSVKSILEELYAYKGTIVPTFKLLRFKTGKTYYTFCTDEAIRYMIRWLLLKMDMLEFRGKELGYDDKVWDLSKRQISYHFQSVNDQLGWGYKRKYRFFRPHTLRKFMASNIGLSEENVDFLQGRSKDKLHATYIKANPNRLKELYMSVMDNVTILHREERIIRNEEFNIILHIHFHGDKSIENIIL